MKNKTGFVLTSNRDEMAIRPTLPIQKEVWNGQALYFPKDENAGGSWIVMRKGKVACLLNGAFEAHQRKPPYDKSRGVVLLETLSANDSLRYLNIAILTRVEPFTLVLFDTDNERLLEFRWDGQQKYFKDLDVERPHFWSSAPLYNQETRKQRYRWFQHFIQNNSQPVAEKVLKFHGSSKTNDESIDLLMNRPDGKRTVSITQLVIAKHKITMRYEDLQKEKISYAEVE